MRLLLDTHTFIWLATNDPQLSPPAQAAIAASGNDVFLSAVSTWEMAIKIAIGKITLAVPLESFVASQRSLRTLLPLDITSDHTYRVGTLPLHHNDPFDRLLIAQAMVEGLTILTRDAKFIPYGVPILW